MRIAHVYHATVGQLEKMSSKRVYRASVPHGHMHSARSDLGGRRERGINGEVQRIW